MASHPTVSRLIATLAADADDALGAINTARTAVRAAAWSAAGSASPQYGITAQAPLVIDIDATLVTAHSEKESAAPTYKRGFGFHPLCAFADHGSAGTGEPLAILLRPGNAGSNTAADHKRVLIDALAQLPGDPAYRVGRTVLVRADSGGGTREFLTYRLFEVNRAVPVQGCRRVVDVGCPWLSGIWMLRSTQNPKESQGHGRAYVVVVGAGRTRGPFGGPAA